MPPREAWKWPRPGRSPSRGRGGKAFGGLLPAHSRSSGTCGPSGDVPPALPAAVWQNFRYKGFASSFDGEGGGGRGARLDLWGSGEEGLGEPKSGWSVTGGPRPSPSSASSPSLRRVYVTVITAGKE